MRTRGSLHISYVDDPLQRIFRAHIMAAMSGQAVTLLCMSMCESGLKVGFINIYGLSKKCKVVEELIKSKQLYVFATCETYHRKQNDASILNATPVDYKAIERARKSNIKTKGGGIVYRPPGGRPTCFFYKEYVTVIQKLSGRPEFIDRTR